MCPPVAVTGRAELARGDPGVRRHERQRGADVGVEVRYWGRLGVRLAPVLAFVVEGEHRAGGLDAMEDLGREHDEAVACKPLVHQRTVGPVSWKMSE